jgi:hypothetical protein
MKKYANIVLLSILAALFYNTPAFLIDSVNSSLGKLSWMVIIFVVYQMLDKVSAVILAIIMITLLHQNIEGFEDKKDDNSSEKLSEMEDEELDEEENNNKKSKKTDKKTKKTEEDKKEMEEDKKEMEEDKKEMEEVEQEGFELLSKSKKECETYDKEGFTGFTELLKKFKVPVTTTNTTDLDRELKITSERSTINSSKE